MCRVAHWRRCEGLLLIDGVLLLRVRSTLVRSGCARRGGRVRLALASARTAYTDQKETIPYLHACIDYSIIDDR